MLDVMNTLGLSNTVMRLIEKRSAQVFSVYVCVCIPHTSMPYSYLFLFLQDRLIFFGGVIVTLIIMYLVIRYALWQNYFITTLKQVTCLLKYSEAEIAQSAATQPRYFERMRTEHRICGRVTVLEVKFSRLKLLNVGAIKVAKHWFSNG